MLIKLLLITVNQEKIKERIRRVANINSFEFSTILSRNFYFVRRPVGIGVQKDIYIGRYKMSLPDFIYWDLNPHTLVTSYKTYTYSTNQKAMNTQKWRKKTSSSRIHQGIIFLISDSKNNPHKFRHITLHNVNRELYILPYRVGKFRSVIIPCQTLRIKSFEWKTSNIKSYNNNYENLRPPFL